MAPPPFPFLATTTYAMHGMVASIDPLASAAGVSMLRAGGSAADAAIAANAVLAVTTPHMCGVGGDLLALVHHEAGAPAALCSTGRSGSGADPGRLRREGHTVMPFRGNIASVTVPGCVDGWLALHERFGRVPLDAVLAPAVESAIDGFPASVQLSGALPLIDGVEGSTTIECDRPCRPGARVRRPSFGRTLQAIAHGRADFYEGEFGAGLVALGEGLFEADDLRRNQADWVEPIGAPAWGHHVWTMPPGSQGYLTLAALELVQQLSLPDDPDDPLWPHLLAEAARVAGFDRLEVLHDGADHRSLLDPARLADRLTLIDRDRRCHLPAAPSAGGDTIYLCAVDGDRMGVSLIQSNAADFGAHIIEPTTGVFLHNRGIGFSLVPEHPAELGPGRRPTTTLSPALVTDRHGGLRATVGTMGGDVQPQVVLQLVTRLLHAGQSAGSTLRSPRWILESSTDQPFQLWATPGPDRVGIEPHAPSTWQTGLEVRGHTVVRLDPRHPGTGHASLIECTTAGLAGAAEPRAGGAASVY